MRRRQQAGFTLVEMLIATAVVSILTGAMSSFFAAQILNIARADGLSILQSNTKQAIEIIAKDVRAARTVETSNILSDANGPGGNVNGWTSTSTSPSTVVLQIPSQDTYHSLMYVDVNHNTTYNDDVIYYIANAGTNTATLYRRTLANSVTGNAAKTTCPPPGTVSCPSDIKVVDNIANLVVTYYDTNNAVTSNVTFSYSIQISLSEYRYVFGRKVTSTINSRVSLRNKP